VDSEQAKRGQTSRIRRVFRDESVWTVREAAAGGVPGSKGSACLIFEAPERIRRVWLFPANWRELDDGHLWELCDRRPLASDHLDELTTGLNAAISEAMENIARSRAILRVARSAVTASRADREKLRDLLQQCRAERERMRVAVQSHALDLRDAGMTKDDASLLVSNAVREAAVRLDNADVSVNEFQQNADRWCKMVYRAA
jgi:hypothetical protein